MPNWRVSWNLHNYYTRCDASWSTVDTNNRCFTIILIICTSMYLHTECRINNRMLYHTHSMAHVPYLLKKFFVFIIFIYLFSLLQNTFFLDWYTPQHCFHFWKQSWYAFLGIARGESVCEFSLTSSSVESFGLSTCAPFWKRKTFARSRKCQRKRFEL